LDGGRRPPPIWHSAGAGEAIRPARDQRLGCAGPEGIGSPVAFTGSGSYPWLPWREKAWPAAC